MNHTINRTKFSMDIKLFIEGARKLGIKSRIIDAKQALVQYEYKGKKIYRKDTANLETPLFSSIFARKDLTYRLLRSNKLPVPNNRLVSSISEAEKAIKKIGFPCVVKSTIGCGGFFVFTHINSLSRLQQSARKALARSKQCIIEELLTGNDYRVLATPSKIIHTVKRYPARVFGDGKSTIVELIERENAKPWRGKRLMQELVKIKMDEETKYQLHQQGKNLQSVPKPKEEVPLKGCCNQCKGGEVESVPGIHSDFADLATKATKIMKAPLAGVDIMVKDITKPMGPKNKTRVIEVNEAPGLQIHQIPTHGKGINVVKEVFEVLFETNFE